MIRSLSAGRLEDHPFAEISGLIFQGSLSGELILESGNRRRSVWFLGGNPVSVVSNDPQDHIAQFLLEHGKISDEDAQRLATLPETREALGTADFLPKETLDWGVKSRFVNLCYDLFRWEEGDYAFHEGDPPRGLFLLKVPAHSLIFKGVGLLGLAAIIDAVPDDAVCSAGPVAVADARYLNPEAHHLLEQCQTGRTVAEALGGSSIDLDQARRLMYALICLGLVSLARAPAAAPPAAPAPEDDTGFILDEDGDALLAPAAEPGISPAQDVPAGLSLEEGPVSGGTLPDLPPFDEEPLPPAAPLSGFDADGNLPPPQSSTLDDGSGPGLFGTFGPETTFDDQNGLPPSSDEEQKLANAAAAHPGRRLRLPRLVGIVLGALAAAGIVALAGWWWMSGSEPSPPTVRPPVKRPAPAGGGAVAIPPVTPPAPIAPVSVPAPTPPPPAAAVAPAPAIPAPSAPPVPAAGAPSQRSVPVSSGASGADRHRTALEIFRAGDLDGAAAIWEALLNEEHRGAFTVQVLTACQHDTIRDAQRSAPAQELYLVTKQVKGRMCYRVCLGTFTSREAAARALAGLPGDYRAGGAAVRPVADVLNRDR